MIRFENPNLASEHPLTMKKFVILILPFLSLNCRAQQFQYPDLSPQTVIYQEIGNTNFELRYSRPAVRGRKIFGELIPYGKVWRTGASECNIFKFDRAVKIAGQEIPPGEYSLLTIPDENEWSIIFNTNTQMYGLDGYDENNNILRFSVPSVNLDELIETFTIAIDFIPNDALLSIEWEHTRVSFLIETSTDEDVLKFIQNELLTKSKTEADDYLQAADFLIREKSDYPLALKLTDYALEIDDSEYARRVRSDIFVKSGQKEKAKTEIKKAIELVKNSNLSEPNKKWSYDFWENELRKLNSNP